MRHEIVAATREMPTRINNICLGVRDIVGMRAFCGVTLAYVAKSEVAFYEKWRFDDNGMVIDY